MFLVYGGSHAYGTSTPTSDIDIRGCAFNRKQELLGLSSFEQVVALYKNKPHRKPCPLAFSRITPIQCSIATSRGEIQYGRYEAKHNRKNQTPQKPTTRND